MRPILFKTEMVKAILEGRKSVTRRDPFQMPEHFKAVDGMYRDDERRLCAVFHSAEELKAVYPRYDREDILWVRETWACPSKVEINNGANPNAYIYKADKPALPCAYDRWRPSIHMPQEAARIFLRVTGVRVERLQDMRLKDCEKEGIQLNFVESADLVMGPIRARERFSGVWDGTIKPKDLSTCGWEANPWVWVIEFERISKDEAMGRCAG